MQHCNTHHTSQEQGYQHQTVAGSREVKCSLVSSIKVSFQWGGTTTPCTRNTWAISPQQLPKFTQILLSSHHLECTATSISISISSLSPQDPPSAHSSRDIWHNTPSQQSLCSISIIPQLLTVWYLCKGGYYSYYLIISLQPVLLHQELICHLLSTNPQYYHVSSARNHHHQQHSPCCLHEEEPVWCSPDITKNNKQYQSTLSSHHFLLIILLHIIMILIGINSSTYHYQSVKHHATVYWWS